MPYGAATAALLLLSSVVRQAHHALSLSKGGGKQLTEVSCSAG